MNDTKKGSMQSLDKITNYLGYPMVIGLKNKHIIKGTLAYFHLQEQTIHVQDWTEYDSTGALVRSGKFMVVNRTAWYEIHEGSDVV